MHTSLREVGYPSPKYWKEPMPLFISHAVMLKKGPVYKAINLWRNGVVKVCLLSPPNARGCR